MEKRSQNVRLLWLSGTAGILALVLWLWRVPQWGVPDSVIDPKERAELLNANRSSVIGAIQMIGGLGFIATAYLAWRNLQVVEQNYQISKDKQVTDRFSKAVEMLASEKLEVRLGGIYLLERIAKDSPEDHPVVMEVLCAYVRDKAAIEFTEQSSKEFDDDMEIYIPKQDIQSTLTVIGRRTRAEGEIIDLSYTSLQQAKLSEADLSGAKLSGADLSEADLSEADLSGAKLWKTDLSRAKLKKADLSGAKLSYTKLPGADLSYTNLSGAKLKKADLSYADLSYADLSYTKLSNVKLSGAKLWKTDLSGADLSSADLRGALLDNVRADERTVWPDKSNVTNTKNIPDWLRKQLDIETEDRLEISENVGKTEEGTAEP